MQKNASPFDIWDIVEHATHLVFLSDQVGLRFEEWETWQQAWSSCNGLYETLEREHRYSWRDCAEVSMGGGFGSHQVLNAGNFSHIGQATPGSSIHTFGACYFWYFSSFSKEESKQSSFGPFSLSKEWNRSQCLGFVWYGTFHPRFIMKGILNTVMDNLELK